MGAYKKLENQREILLSNIDDLKETQLFLTEKLERLKNKSDFIKLMSRQLGYADKHSNEKLFLLEGYKEGYVQYNPGKMIFFKDEKSNSNLFLRILGFLIGFMVYTIILVCIRIAENGTKHKHHRVVSRNNSIINQE